MLPIPAIDLKNGKVVRLFQGNFKEEKVYPEGPEVLAQRFEEEGAARIHVVDLDGALKGIPRNTAGIEKILRHTKARVQVGGGVRDLKTAELYLDMGAAYVIMGTKACFDKGLMKEAFAAFGEKIIVGIDALDGWVATDGWTNVTKIQAVDFAKQATGAGAKTIIYTDISKDGTLKGPNLPEIQKMCQAVTTDIIASGGVGSLEDLRKLMDLQQNNLKGVIIGKALYENKFTLKDAIRKCLRNA